MCTESLKKIWDKVKEIASIYTREKKEPNKPMLLRITNNNECCINGCENGNCKIYNTNKYYCVNCIISKKIKEEHYLKNGRIYSYI